ncbi:MAG: peptide chain release factor 1 [Magnetococcales bacterium]|nr:peptide chain release factor 1 [Magnetococcales bacterium]HIJ85017.1 peptide chain release factor 1 [Magnetococcales bacterium]
MSFLSKLNDLQRRHGELAALLSQAEVMADSGRFSRLSREYAGLDPVVAAFKDLQAIDTEIVATEALLVESQQDPELRSLARDEREILQTRREQAWRDLQVMLLPKDRNDQKNAILEIRAGTGGEEAALFAGEMLRMYQRFAESRGWRMELLSTHATDLGGFKEIIVMVSGKGVFSSLKFESGVHRVQRVPVTEAGGRIHTSACTVAVLPEAEEVDVVINEREDLRIDVYRSSGPGGQSVNTTDSAVRITHLPSGLVVVCQDEKSQHKNKAKALKVLKARLYDIELKAAEEARSRDRKGQVGSGDRSERIRTYNFPQGRLTDHRINLTIYRLDQVLQGDLEEVISALSSDYQAKLLAEFVDSP